MTFEQYQAKLDALVIESIELYGSAILFGQVVL